MKITYSLVGMSHQKSEAIVSQLQVGTALTLVREPRNSFDRNAVSVWHGGQRLGYISSKKNAGIAKILEERGEPFTPPADSPTMAMDGAPIALGGSLPCTFQRSFNSGYPQIVVEE